MSLTSAAQPGARPTGGLHPWLRRAYGARPDHPALIRASDGVTTSYAELASRVEERAGQLVAAGLQPGQRLALWSGNDRLSLELVHAALRLGAPLVPLHTRLTPRELEPLLEDTAPGLLVCDAERHAQTIRSPLVPPPRVLASEELLGLGPAPIGDRPIDLDLDHAILFTSGTTGRPKGVRLGLAQHEASARASAERLGAAPDDRWLLCMPLYHIAGLAIVMRSLLHGTTLVLEPRFEPASVAQALARHSVTHVSLVPTMLSRLLALDPGARAPVSLRCVLLGGGPIAPELIERALEHGWPLCATYGMTESASQLATTAPGDPDPAWLPPLPRTELRVVSPDGSDLPPGEAGEIWARGPQVMRGYLERPEATARALEGGWLHTGDIGELDSRGRLRVLDRRTDLIVSGGENVYPADVEAALARHPHVVEAGVVAEPDPEWGQRVVAVVVHRSSAPAGELEQELRDLCVRELAGFKRPRRWVICKAPLPRTASGKLRRDLLREWIQP